MFLAQHGCPSQQGWLHGRPMAPQPFLQACRPDERETGSWSEPPVTETSLNA